MTPRQQRRPAYAAMCPMSYGPRLILWACEQVCCGGVQSAHTAAVACLCAEHGVRAHCLIRGERPAVPSGHLLLASMFGSVQHVTRAEYADRAGMLAKHAARIAAEGGPARKVRRSAVGHDAEQARCARLEH